MSKRAVAIVIISIAILIIMWVTSATVVDGHQIHK